MMTVCINLSIWQPKDFRQLHLSVTVSRKERGWDIPPAWHERIGDLVLDVKRSVKRLRGSDDPILSLERLIDRELIETRHGTTICLANFARPPHPGCVEVDLLDVGKVVQQVAKLPLSTKRKTASGSESLDAGSIQALAFLPPSATPSPLQ